MGDWPIMTFGAVVLLGFLCFLGFLVWADSSDMERCVRAGGSWVGRNCLVQPKRQP